MIKEKYEKLIKASGDDADFVADQMDNFRRYVNSVVEMEIRLPLLRMRCSSIEDYQEKVMELDKKRRSSHECAIDSCNILNRLSEKLGLPAFFEGDTNDRYEVADFCLQVINELFLERDTTILELAAQNHYIAPLRKEG